MKYTVNILDSCIGCNAATVSVEITKDKGRNVLSALAFIYCLSSDFEVGVV